MIRELSLLVRGSDSVWVGTARPDRPRCGDRGPRRPRRRSQQSSAGDRLTCPLQRRWSARCSRGPKCTEVETLDTGEGWRKQEGVLPKRGCGAPKEATAFPRETEEAEEGRERRKGVPTPGGGRAGTRRNPPMVGRAAGKTAEVTAAKAGRRPASLGSSSAAQFLPGPGSASFPRRVASCFWGGRGHPMPARQSLASATSQVKRGQSM